MSNESEPTPDRRPPRRWFTRKDADLSVETVASRTEAYVYGNILVLAALATLTPDDVPHGHAAVVVIGTGVSTYLAHVLAHWIGHQVRGSAQNGPGKNHAAHLRRGVRNAMPIASSAVGPALLMLASFWGWPPAEWAIPVAIAIIIGRFLLFGPVLTSLSGSRNSFVALLTGIGLAVAGILVAAIKLVLTH